VIKSGEVYDMIYDYWLITFIWHRWLWWWGEGLPD
jgi:hypothetical protein